MGSWIIIEIRGEANSLTSAIAANFAEMYLNLGYFGVILGSLKLGVIFKIINNYYNFQLKSNQKMGPVYVLV